MDLPAGGEEDVTVAVALKNAARLLHYAELETDLGKMERIESLADTWVSIASLLSEKEPV